MKKGVTHCEQHTLIIKSILNFVGLTTLLVRRDKIFTPVLNPFDGLTQLNCCKGRKNFFRIKEHDFCTKTTSDIGSDHAYFMFGQVENSC